MKKIALIGCTGSIGCQTLNVVRRHPDKFKIVSMAAGGNYKLFAEQLAEFSPSHATVATEEGARYCLSKTGKAVSYGENAFTEAIIDEADVVVIALVGFKGLIAVLDAIKKGKNIALANKESLVVGGTFVMQKAKQAGVKIVPIDSEHSAIWQALDFDFNKPFNKLILTASGGAFRDMSKDQLASVRAKDALKHPNWNMGAKITVDCATLVNKAFEVVEAKWLYSAPLSKIDVIIHRESIIHSMVEFEDGACLAQMSYPTMEIPIQMALTYPDRYATGIKGLDFAALKSLSFEEVDKSKYPCFDLVLEGVNKGANYAAVVNGANEAAVKLFLQDKISFYGIYDSIKHALNAYSGKAESDEAELFSCDAFARAAVEEKFGK